MMLLFWVCQFVSGWKEHNQELVEHHQPPLSWTEYFSSGHFATATFENWESEFLQMAIYVLLTVGLRQKGSSESKKLNGEEGAGEEEVDKDPQPNPNAPWPVRKGGIWLALYKNSLSIAFTLLFILSNREDKQQHGGEGLPPCLVEGPQHYPLPFPLENISMFSCRQY